MLARKEYVALLKDTSVYEELRVGMVLLGMVG